MHTISTALAAHLAGEVTTLATCWRAQLADGTVYGFTDASEDLTFEGVRYAAATGYTPSAISGGNTLAADNLEVAGMLDSAGITEADLNAGRWDYAEIHVFLVNYRDLTMGALKLVAGRLGEVTMKRGAFTAELRSLADAYNRTLAELYGPACRARFGSAQCGVTASSYAVVGTIDSASADGRVLFDAARLEPGPAGGHAITAIARGAQTLITCPGHGFRTGATAYISGVVGMAQPGGNSLNGRNYFVFVVDADHFKIFVDTRLLAANAADGPTDASQVYSNYISGGSATQAGDGGYFAYGLLRMATGLNANLEAEVQSYAPGAITLRLALPHPVAAGDQYLLIPGCGKRYAEDCIGRYDNGINFRGEPYLPGLDRIIIFGGQAPGQGGQ